MKLLPIALALALVACAHAPKPPVQQTETSVTFNAMFEATDEPTSLPWERPTISDVGDMAVVYRDSLVMREQTVDGWVWVMPGGLYVRFGAAQDTTCLGTPFWWPDPVSYWEALQIVPGGVCDP